MVPKELSPGYKKEAKYTTWSEFADMEIGEVVRYFSYRSISDSDLEYLLNKLRQVYQTGFLAGENKRKESTEEDGECVIHDIDIEEYGNKRGGYIKCEKKK